nr:serine/threonine protein kinase [Deltaproteobacteria bacterium]
MTACPDDDTLGAMVDRSLAADALESVSTHLDDCATCRAVVLAAVRGGIGAQPIADTAPVTVVERTPVSGAPSFTVGGKIGRYDVHALIGGGGMGHVYEAHDKELDRAIALKILRPELRSSTAVLAERLIRESRMMAKVVHPSVITVYDVGREGDAVFIAMELIRGDTLGGYARGKPWQQIVALYERAGEGLAAAHEAGIVHRDFKPDNVLIDTATERVVVTDFGIARTGTAGDVATGERPAVGDVKLTTTGAAIGTPAYMAPEQLAGRPIDVRADVFAFSVSLWEGLFGERPFPGTTVKAIEEAMRRPPRAVAGASVPRRVVKILERGLAIDPDDRWSALSPMLSELAAARRGRRGAWIAAAAIAVAA